MGTIKWLDLSADGSKLSWQKLDNGKNAFILTGKVLNNSPARSWALANKFHPTPNGLGLALIQDSAEFPTNGVKQAFPNLKVVEIDENSFFDYINTSEQAKVNNQVQRNKSLGINAKGEEVFESATGERFIKDANLTINEQNPSRDLGNFLRVNSPDDFYNLKLCADAFVLRTIKTPLNKQVLLNFAAIIYGKEIQEEQREFQELLNQLNNAYYHQINIQDQPDRIAFDYAVVLNQNMPQVLENNLPLPIAVGIQRIIGNCDNQRILISSFSNGWHSAMLAKSANKTIVDKDPKQISKAKTLLGDNLGLLNGNVNDIDFVNNKFQTIVANLEVNANPADYAQNIRHLLNNRQDNGQAVFIIPKQLSDDFVQALNRDYQIALAEINQSLYYRAENRRDNNLLIVGKRREPEEQVPDKLKISTISNWGELWQFCDNNAFVKLTGIGEHLHIQSKEVNEHHVGYRPASKIGEASAVIPRYLEIPISKSLNRLQKELGDLDDYVANKLQLDKQYLATCFNPEQIDAIALIINSAERAQGFILGDQTGAGKGRVCAALCRYTVLNGSRAVYISERRDLFTDIWRDLESVCPDRDAKELFRPFIVNTEGLIKDQKNQIVYQKQKAEVVKDVIKSKISSFPEKSNNANLVLATYSQFNRQDSLKSQWLKEISKDAVIVLDESHNAAGNSNTFENVIGGAVVAAKSVLYSSGTYAKNPDNFLAYHRAFPKSIEMLHLQDKMVTIGNEMIEAVSAMLVENGTMIRRELNLTGVKIQVKEAEDEQLYTNKVYADKLASILSIMNDYSFILQKVFHKQKSLLPPPTYVNSEKGRKHITQMLTMFNLGNRLYTIMRQFNLAIATPMVIEEALEALRTGKKPVIVTEQTMSALLVQIASDNNEDFELDLDDRDIGVKADMTIPTPTYTDVLKKVAERLGICRYKTITRSYIRGLDEPKTTEEVVEKNIIDFATKEQKEKILRIQKRLDKAIAVFPELPISPIDLIKKQITEHGYSCDEISGRGFVAELGDAQTVLKRREDNRNDVIYNFNNGDLNALIITRAGSSGISLHSSEHFVNQNQRVMIEAQQSQNIFDYIQFLGRVNRIGSVNAPQIISINTGLPAEARLLAMQNSKLRSLSAAVQSNHRNSLLNENIPDILNSYGNEVAKRYCQNNPAEARSLNITVNSTNDNKNNYYINRLMMRLCFLSIDNQEHILNDVYSLFKEHITELKNMGRDVLQTDVFKVKNLQYGEKELFEGAEGYTNSVFDNPIYYQPLQWQKKYRPLSFQNVFEQSIKNLQNFNNDHTLVDVENNIEILINKTKENFENEIEKNYILSDNGKSFIRQLNEEVFTPATITKGFGGGKDYLLNKASEIVNVLIHTSSERHKELIVEAGTLIDSYMAKPLLKMMHLYNFVSEIMNNPGKHFAYSHKKDLDTGNYHKCVMITAIKPPVQAASWGRIGQWKISFVEAGAEIETTMNATSFLNNYRRIDKTPEQLTTIYDEYQPQDRLMKGAILTGNAYKIIDYINENPSYGKIVSMIDENGVTNRYALSVQNNIDKTNNNIDFKKMSAKTSNSIYALAYIKSNTRHNFTFSNRTNLAVNVNKPNFVLSFNKNDPDLGGRNKNPYKQKLLNLALKGKEKLKNDIVNVVFPLTSLDAVVKRLIKFKEMTIPNDERDIYQKIVLNDDEINQNIKKFDKIVGQSKVSPPPQELTDGGTPGLSF